MAQSETSPQNLAQNPAQLAAQLTALLAEARVIEADGYGVKVARLADGSFIKLYRRKRWLSRALWMPAARRFAEHAAQLRVLGFVTPQVLAWWRIPEKNLSAVRYQPLPGESLRTRWPGLSEAQRELEAEQFGALLARLHEHGVYFRSVHLGNVLRLSEPGAHTEPNLPLGLIDLADIRFSHRPLSACKRRRNLHHILRYPEDAAWLLGAHRTAWLRGYEQASSTKDKALLASALAAYCSD